MMHLEILVRLTHRGGCTIIGASGLHSPSPLTLHLHPRGCDELPPHSPPARLLLFGGTPCPDSNRLRGNQALSHFGGEVNTKPAQSTVHQLIALLSAYRLVSNSYDIQAAVAMFT